MEPEVAAGVLHIPLSATEREVKRAFRLLARATHPDLHSGASESELKAAAAEFTRLTDARDALLAYIAAGRPEAMRAPKATPSAPPASPSTSPSAPPARDSAHMPTEKPRPSAAKKAAPWLVAAAVLAVVLTLATANHWKKIDIPAAPETFHLEHYLTGEYDVNSGVGNPCWIGQDWTDCINARVAQYNGACAGVQLSSLARQVCTSYSSAIDDMKKTSGYGYTVSSLGSYGYLNKVPVTSTRKVSNNDARPAATHEAVCYLGFIGECA